ncbi:hypothetical protein F5Y17DRAFT_462038 [Xylariaceae sp. FL0594]|nr:hypothetical protein F5Y17DRAFT_462038 [Xylariaceae sp. FL0594]
MATKQHRLYIFGDQTYDARPQLKRLSRCRENPLLDAFLAKVYEVLREELHNLPVEIRDDLPRFTCVDDLLLWEPDDPPYVPLDMAVTCIYQLGTFIISQTSTWDLGNEEEDCCVLGICTGALSAAAVGCSRSAVELLPLAVEAVVVAFRTGLCVNRMAQRIEPPRLECNRPWSLVVPGLASAEAARKYCETPSLPPLNRPYISAYAPNGVTVSGSPHSLQQLSESMGSLDPSTFKALPVYAPYHAPHLYTLDDVAEAIGGLRTPHAKVYIPALSGTGQTTHDGSYVDLLKSAVEQILLQPIDWSGILKGLHSHLDKGQSKSFVAVPIGTKADQLIFTALKQTGFGAILPAPALAIQRSEEEAEAGTNHSRPKLAIVGMSGRFPGARDNEEFWELLRQGLDMHKEVPDLRWDAKTHVDPTGVAKNTSTTPFGCWLDDPAAFDARFFNISPREAPQIDPAQRIALMTAYEAIEQAGIVPDATPSTRRDRVGVFYGVTSQDWFETNSAQEIDTYFIPGGNMAFIPGRINYFFKFSGPSYAINTACSSSLAGIHLACNSLWQGDIDTAIAGGTNILTNPDMTAGLDKGHFLSRTGNCKTFDDSADGYCRGEGVGTVIIKRLSDAVADRDPILGVILGAYTNHSAESESITRPHVGAQRAVFGKILNQCGVDPYTVGYVEMHGTGTQAGDAGEMSSVLDTFAPPPEKSKRGGRSGAEPLFLGSAKANIGHGEAASGIASLIKVLLMMQKKEIVPHCGIKTKINHKFPTDLEHRNVHIALKPTHWERSVDPAKPRRVFVNNFSAAGGNTALLLEDAPLKAVHNDEEEEEADTRSHHVVAISAKNGVSLQGNLRSLLTYLDRNPGVSLGQLSYTTTARRIHHQHRVMIASSSAEDLHAQVTAALNDHAGMARPKGSPKVVFTFTGQGAQYPGMGQELYRRFTSFREEMRRLDRIGGRLGFPSFMPVVDAAAGEQDIGLFSPITVQLASICMQIALAKLWASWGIKPAAVTGHSLGEYAALNIAGVLSDVDTIYLVGMRARLLEERCTKNTHSMLVIKAALTDIAKVLTAEGMTYEVACINSPSETVLAGTDKDVAAIKEALTQKRMKTTLLKVPYAFHSSQVDLVLDEFTRIAANVVYSEAKIPVICPLDGNLVVGAGVFGPEYLARHTREPVNMLRALLTAHSHGILVDKGIALEIGPHPAISGMIKATLEGQVTCLAALQRGRPTFQVLAAALKSLYSAGANIRWPAYHQDFRSSHRVLSMPAYSWDLKPYWIQYVHDWSLRKGDPLITIASGGDMEKLESTTIHRVVEDWDDGKKARLVVESDVARKDFRPLVEGHEVDGVPLCTPAVYADIALTLGRYLGQRHRRVKGGGGHDCLEIANMTILKGLVLKADGDNAQQLLQAHAEADWSSDSATVKFKTFDSRQDLQEHSHCVVRFNNGSCRDKLLEVTDIARKIRVLRDGITTGETARFNRAMVYRAIRPLARFHDEYRAVDEIVLDSNTLEATSRLSFKDFHKDGTFHTHPGLIDGLTWAAGFTMNCNDYNDLDKDVYVNHGWDSFQIFEPLDFAKEYTTYSRMIEGEGRLWRGEVYILNGENIVAHFAQFAMQGVPRRVLKAILAAESGSKASKARQQVMQKPATGKQPYSRSSQIQVPAPPSPSATASQALAIIAEESGLAESDLTDGTVFSDVGIDSLLGLTISSRFREELELDVDFNALFYEYPTVGDLKAFLADNSSSSAKATPAATEPASSGSSDTEETNLTSSYTDDDEREGQRPISIPSSSAVDFERVLEIVSEESGVAREDLTDDASFADCGVDSLLSLVIVGRFRDELELDIQHESLFLECPTVANLRRLLLAGGDKNEEPERKKHPDPDPPVTLQNDTSAATEEGEGEEEDDTALLARKRAVDEYVAKYTAGFHGPTAPPSSSSAEPPLLHYEDDTAKVVLVTGGTGCLGGHLVRTLASRPDVQTVVCVNRKHRTDAFERQKKAMRDKGVHFPEEHLHKLLVLQTDTSEPRLGLSDAEYDRLAGSVTHIIHQAWPMSVKRPLAGFEPQFAVMRHLIDLAVAIAAARRKKHAAAAFRVGFQLVSSISVVGNYNKGNRVPEGPVGIDAVLAVGYAEAKWGCERMLDETLRRSGYHRATTVRLGQMAGSTASGYWNPTEHFGFMLRSAQTLNALPDTQGAAHWTPVDVVAATLADLLFFIPNPITPESECDSYAFYHVENPVGQPWKQLNSILADALNIPAQNLIPLEEWTRRVRSAGSKVKKNPAVTLVDFLERNYARMSCGGLVLDPANAVEHSPTLAKLGPVSEDAVRRYIGVWKKIGFLD